MTEQSPRWIRALRGEHERTRGILALALAAGNEQGAAAGVQAVRDGSDVPTALRAIGAVASDLRALDICAQGLGLHDVDGPLGGAGMTIEAFVGREDGATVDLTNRSPAELEALLEQTAASTSALRARRGNGPSASADLGDQIADILDARRGRKPSTMAEEGGGWMMMIDGEAVDMGDPYATAPDAPEPEPAPSGADLAEEIAARLEERRGGREAIEDRRRTGARLNPNGGGDVAAPRSTTR